MTNRAAILGISLALAAVVLPTKLWAGSDSYVRLAAPFSPNATIYRPDCWTMEVPSNPCAAAGTPWE
jgi:hypothetical protein